MEGVVGVDGERQCAWAIVVFIFHVNIFAANIFPNTISVFFKLSPQLVRSVLLIHLLISAFCFSQTFGAGK